MVEYGHYFTQGEKMIKAVIFDLDGVVIDSEPIAYSILQELAGAYGHSIPLNDYTTKYLGRTVAMGMHTMIDSFGLPISPDDLFKKYVEKEKLKNEEGVPLKPGARELLVYLKDNGYKTIVASSSTRARAEKILGDNDILKYFDDLVFGYEVPRGKPYPDIFLKACEKLGVEKNETIIIEDSEAGIDAGFSAEIPVICIPDMKIPDKEHMRKTFFVMDSLFDVIEYLKKPRCRWCNVENELYVKYHDEEWGKLQTDDHYLFEMLVLEGFQAGLSWECVLNKRSHFRLAFDNFDIEKIIRYDENKLNELYNNKDIIRNKRKINATVKNANIFKSIINEYGSFYKYLKTFTNGEFHKETGLVSSPLSDKISNDLRKRGMSFVGTVIIYSYLQAIGIINSHDENCFLC